MPFEITVTTENAEDLPRLRRRVQEEAERQRRRLETLRTQVLVARTLPRFMAYGEASSPTDVKWGVTYGRAGPNILVQSGTGSLMMHPSSGWGLDDMTPNQMQTFRWEMWLAGKTPAEQERLRRWLEEAGG